MLPLLVHDEFGDQNQPFWGHRHKAQDLLQQFKIGSPETRGRRRQSDCSDVTALGRGGGKTSSRIWGILSLFLSQELILLPPARLRPLQARTRFLT